MKRSLLDYLMCLFLMLCAGSFIQMDIDVRNWTEFGRFLVLFLSFGLWCAITVARSPV